MRYLVQADQLHELTSLSNPDNGQRADLLAALRLGFYGVPILPEELTPESIPAGVVFVLRKDPRLELVMPSDSWEGALELVHDDSAMRVALRAGGGR